LWAQQRLYLTPEPQGQMELRPGSAGRRMGCGAAGCAGLGRTFGI
jgi:hypothetical protein